MSKKIRKKCLLFDNISLSALKSMSEGQKVHRGASFLNTTLDQG